MTRIAYRRNRWRNVIQARCLDCGEEVEIKNHQIVGSLGKSWRHECNGKELLGQEVKP